MKPGRCKDGTARTSCASVDPTHFSRDRRLCGALQGVRSVPSGDPRNRSLVDSCHSGTRVAIRRAMDFTQYPMGFIGGLVALFIFGVFIGTWWWYGMREMDRRASPQPAIAPPDSEPQAHAHPARA
jgi:hypothetical protein